MKVPSFDYKKGRERTVDYISVAETIAQSYPDSLIPSMDSTTHGLQKDAIQNGWDNRRAKRSPLRFRFTVAKNAMGQFLLLEDEGTGLTGKVWNREKLAQLDELGVELHPNERWARFESFGFMREAAGGIGSRGQGKFLFIHASRSHEIVYETRLHDGTYRVGATRASRIGCPMLSWEGKAAEKKLEQRCALEPMRHAGTRVVICDINPAVTKSIRNGTFLRSIEETWWRNIQKGQAEILVLANGTQAKAAVPAIYPIPSEGTKGPVKHRAYDIKIWTPDLRKLHLPDGGRFKAFEVCYRNDLPIPDELKGVAVLHYGMKVATIPPQYLPKDISDGIYGYVEFDEAVDEELRKRENQKPNHYDLIWGRRLPHAIRQIIRDQIEEFARTELGQGTSPQQKLAQLQTDAEDLALRELIDACNDLGIGFNQPGNISPKKGTNPPTTPRPLGLIFHDFIWPTPGSRRVEHNQSVHFELLLFNTTPAEYNKCQLVTHVFTPRGGNSVLRLMDKTLSLPKNMRNMNVGQFTVKFDLKRFPAGEYVIRSILRDEHGYELDNQSVHVFVAQDPPLLAPFELISEDWSGIPDWRNVTHTFAPTPEPKVNYNVKHPRYVDAEATGIVIDLAFYLYGLLVQASIQFALYLGRLDPKGYSKVFNVKALTSGEPEEIVKDIHRLHGILMARWK